MNFKEKLTFYDKIQVSDNIIDNLNEIGENLAININFIKRLNYRIMYYSINCIFKLIQLLKIKHFWIIFSIGTIAKT